MAAIAAAIGVSKRCLGMHCRAQFGMPPGRYLRDLRLELARAALETSDVSVTEAATRFGFYDRGRFAGVYCRQFGELPSSTLRRRETPPRLTDV